MSIKSDLLAIGHTAFDFIIKVDSFPEPNTSSTIEEMKQLYGGAAANVAVVGSTIGLKTSLISAVGNDFIHSAYKKNMEKLNIDLHDLIHVEDENTATAFVHTNSNNDQVSYFYWGASRVFKDSNISEKAIDKAKAVHLATGDPDFNSKGALTAKNLDKFVSFDPGQDLHMYTNEKLKEVIENTDILFGNHFEINKILERLNLNIGSLRELGPDIVVKTEGEKGSVIYADEKIAIDSIYRPSVDPTGAGDSYRAGFLRYYLNGESIKKSAQLASSVSSFIVEKLGCQTNIPTFDEAIERMNGFYN